MSVNYDTQASNWQRDEPKHRSDFCGRPEVFDIFNRIGKNKSVLDLGCGEGYFSRKMAPIASKVTGVDSSTGMIELAQERELQDRVGIQYCIGDARELPLSDSSFDVVIGNYIVNYFKPKELYDLYAEISRVLVADGKFVLLMPHPCFELTTDFGSAIQYEDKAFSYLESRGEFFKASLATVQGDSVNVGIYHATLKDQFKAISSARLVVTSLHEPIFPEEISKRNPIFESLSGKVSCMIMTGSKI